MTDLYEDLGIPRDADVTAIKRAHRKAVKATHPDNQDSGDRSKFEKVQRAYLVLADPGKRSKYDATGEVDDGPDNTMTQIVEFIRMAFSAALADNGARYKHYDMIAHTRDRLKLMRRSAEQDAEQARQDMPRLDDILARLKVKDGTRVDPIGDMVREQLGGGKSPRAGCVPGCDPARSGHRLPRPLWVRFRANADAGNTRFSNDRSNADDPRFAEDYAMKISEKPRSSALFGVGWIATLLKLDSRETDNSTTKGTMK